MKHLGDISKINGAGIAPVDIITFGSPCQDLSVAGKQAGLKGERSGLFLEAVRIIKEMRDATNGKQPRFAIWENVPGAFSSNKGADFQTVLLELCKITETKAPFIPIPKAGWPPAGQLTNVGGGSVAYRTIDAQFHGVPQRRRRIILVCDFTGQCAGNLLFKPRGLPGYPAPGVCEGQAVAGAVAVGTDSSVIGFAYKASPSAGSVSAAVDIAPALLAERNDAAICLNDQGGQVMDVSNDITGTLRA
jgi:DNA (cytosine-5)-methyltransferase 1